MNWIARITGIVVVASVLLWCLGTLLSDRWAWSQWLAWIPTLVIILIVLTAGMVFFALNKKIMGVICSSLAITLSAWFCFVENHLLKNSTPSGSLTIVGWTMSHPKAEVATESASLIVQLDADVTLLTHGWHVRGEPSIQEWLGESGRKVVNSQFTLLTKFTPIHVQTLIASEGIYISEFILDTTSVLGDVLVVWAIDLPSSLKLSKMDIAARATRLLQAIEPSKPDIVIGDFNMTRNSVAIQTLFPTLHDISETVGSGYLASFPTNWSLWHIDHILSSDRFQAVDYQLFNSQIGRHRIQIAGFE